ncbi:MAG: PA2778 family cysteine peptidase [Pseudomonadota bacterium]
MPDPGLQLYPLRALIRAGICAAGLMLAGCAAPIDPASWASPGDVPARAAVADVPLIVQDDFYCGPASLAMVYQWAGQEVTQAEVAQQSFTPGARGTYLADMIGNARRRGQLAVTLSSPEDLLAELAAGHPVIVFQNLGVRWLPRWHYGVAVAYDTAAGRIVLHSGESERMVMPLDLFERTWARADYWALVVLPPGEMPALDDEIDLLQAGSALERAGQAAAAAAHYRAGAARYPDNWLWQFGLGNATFAEGDTDGARRAWEAALQIDPEAEEPRENLRRLAGS